MQQQYFHDSQLVDSLKPAQLLKRESSGADTPNLSSGTDRSTDHKAWFPSTIVIKDWVEAYIRICHEALAKQMNSVNKIAGRMII